MMRELPLLLGLTVFVLVVMAGGMGVGMLVRMAFGYDALDRSMASALVSIPFVLAWSLSCAWALRRWCRWRARRWKGVD